MQGEKYWKTLYEQIINYIDHPEAKFEGKEGWLKRRHIKPKEIVWIGKESNKINEVHEDTKVNTYRDREKDKIRILNMSNEEALKRGVSRPTLWKIKEKLRKNPEKFNWNTRAVRKLL